MPKRAYLFATWTFFNGSTLTDSTILNGTISEMLWPQMRSSIANYLVQNQVLAKEEAYRQVFDAIPDSGNCWCFSDKHDTSKGAPQDLYDTACRKFHYCMKCGYNSDLADYDENAVLSIDTSAPTAIFQVTNNLTDVVENNDVINYNSDNNSISIYEWQCDPNQPESALACCKCYTMLEEDFLNVFLSEMDSGTTNSYSPTCSRNGGGDCVGDCPTSGPGTTVPTDDFEDLIHWVAPDSCCGESPTWQAYSAFKKSVTNTKI